jgi:hypothetical protein
MARDLASLPVHDALDCRQNRNRPREINKMQATEALPALARAR